MSEAAKLITVACVICIPPLCLMVWTLFLMHVQRDVRYREDRVKLAEDLNRGRELALTSREMELRRDTETVLKSQLVAHSETAAAVGATAQLHEEQRKEQQKQQQQQ